MILFSSIIPATTKTDHLELTSEDTKRKGFRKINDALLIDLHQKGTQREDMRH